MLSTVWRGISHVTLARDPLSQRYPKQVSFGKDGTVLVGGSDHGAVYIFDTATGCPLDLLRYSDRSLVQTIMVG